MENTAKQNLEILKGGCNVPVETEDGATTELFVRKVPLRQMDSLGRAWGKIEEEFEVYTGKKPEEFTSESVLSAVQEGRRLNFTCFEKWLNISLQTLKPFGGTGLDLESLLQKAAESVAVSESRNGPSSLTKS
jgi:hypothetical protein